jgi:hypothetical protein
MKGKSLSQFLCLFFIVASIAACKRPDNPYPGANMPLLKEWKKTASDVPQRSYLFYYNPYKALDSVRIVESNIEITKTFVKYRNGRLDSVLNYVSGQLEGFLTGYQYDNYGRVIQFYYAPWEGGKIPFTQVFHYTYAGDTAILSWNTIVNHFRFNKQEDVQYISYKGDRPFEATFTFDKNLNPLAAIKDWYLISALEPYLLEYTLSKHNSVLKNYTDGYQARYTNTYNNKNRLIKKELVDPRSNVTQTFEFFYY